MVPAPIEPPKFPPFEYADLLQRGPFGDWRDELAEKGYAVVPAIPRDEALEFYDKAHDYQEGFGLGYKRGDSSTWVNEKLPVHMKGGMIHSYAISHEQFVWDVRSHAGVRAAFAHLWGTPNLVTSFDGLAIMLPGRTDVADEGRWEHTDQSPHRRGMYVVQGLVNLGENGEDDGGLMALEGSSVLFERFFDENGRHEDKTWGPPDWHTFSETNQKWFTDRGCVWRKVCAQPGDLILWDSRTMHYNVRPKGSTDRVCVYVTQAPAHLMSEGDRIKRARALKEYLNTTHLPFDVFVSEHEPRIRADGKPCEKDTGVPRNPVKQTDVVLKLAGVRAY